LQSKILVLQDIAKKYSLTKSFYKQIKSDIEYDQSKISKERNSMIANLPKKLATKLNYLINQKFIENNLYFVDRPVEFVTAVLRFLRPLRANPREVIFKKGDYSDEIYFINSGELTYFENYKKIDIPFEEIGKGEYFGDIEIFFSDLREFSVRAILLSEMLSLCRDDLFNSILQNFESLKVPLIFKSKYRRERLLKVKTDALADYANTKNLANDIDPNMEDQDMSSDANNFKRKFNKLRNTLSPATRILLDPMPSQNFESLKIEIRILTEKLKKLEKYYEDNKFSDKSSQKEETDEKDETNSLQKLETGTLEIQRSESSKKSETGIFKMQGEPLEKQKQNFFQKSRSLEKKLSQGIESLKNEEVEVESLE
jgi:Cyclic nucleotide-binding domain